MNKLVLGFAIFSSCLLVSQALQAQGTLYLSNLGAASGGTLPVGSDSWIALPFVVGGNAGGYALNSVQLAMTDASGNPTEFTVMLDTTAQQNHTAPGSSLATLIGSLIPATGGVYTYSPASSITLLPRNQYFIVLTAGDPVANGAYNLSFAGMQSYVENGNWEASDTAGGPFSTSTDGLSWQYGSFIGPQYALYATALPEPSVEMLLGFGGILLLGFSCRRVKMTP